MVNKDLITLLETDCGLYCPKCGKRLTRTDHDGGRCTNLPKCGAPLTALHTRKQSLWAVKSEQGDFQMCAESEIAIRKSCEKHKINVIEVSKV